MNIVVYGYFNKQNSGDQLFISAFKYLFPEYTFIFTDVLNTSLIEKAYAIFIGGGSLLVDAPNIEQNCLNLLKSKKIAYIGVGAETQMHPIHIELMKVAKLVAIRTPQHINKILNINNNTIYIPDIVYSLPIKNNINKIENSILILNNLITIPTYDEPHWKHVSWEFFKSEFAQSLDYLIEQKYNIDFLAMNNHKELNDIYASYEIVNCMKHKNHNYIFNYTIEELPDILSKYNVIISQRFHGTVLSELCQIPYIQISHHDKMQKTDFEQGNFISYFGFNKQNLIDNFNQVKNKSLQPVNKEIFSILKEKVKELLG